MQRIVPFLWFDSNAEEAANFYVSIFKNSKIVNISRYGDKIVLINQALAFSKKGTIEPKVETVELRAEQSAAVAAWESAGGRGVVVMPTNKVDFASITISK